MHTILDLYYQQLHSNPREKTIIRWVDSRLRTSLIDWQTLENESNRCANCLQSAGCEYGDRVLLYLQSSPVIWFLFLGALKCGAVPCVLFPNFGEEALLTRLRTAEANFLISDSQLTKYASQLQHITSLKAQIFLHPTKETEAQAENALLFTPELFSSAFSPATPEPESAAFMIFTSGSTGQPKAAVHTHSIAEPILHSMHSVLHASKDDVYWCTAHPAWITGTVYGILGPLLAGIESIQYSGNFHLKRWMPILQDQAVTLWYSAPTAFRAMMNEPDETFQSWTYEKLKQIYSIGEPLSAAVFHWGKRVFDKEIMDTWFQTESGCIRIANQPGQIIKPGSMGKAVDDARPVIIDGQGSAATADVIGRLCLHSDWNSRFQGYYAQPDKTAAKFQASLYDTGDMASVDKDGYYWFAGRADDVINTSGHLIGPFEIESVLSAQTEIAEAAVTATPDDLLYEKPVAFLVLRPGFEWNKELETRLRVAVNSALSAYAVPKEFYIMSAMPHTESGKIKRRELKQKTISKS